MDKIRERLPRYMRHHAAYRYSLRVLLHVRPWREEGLPLWRCAARLNREGFWTFTGGPWTVSNLARVLETGRTAAETEFVHTGEREWLRAANHMKGCRYADS